MVKIRDDQVGWVDPRGQVRSGGKRSVTVSLQNGNAIASKVGCGQIEFAVVIEVSSHNRAGLIAAPPEDCVGKCSVAISQHDANGRILVCDPEVQFVVVVEVSHRNPDGHEESAAIDNWRLEGSVAVPEQYIHARSSAERIRAGHIQLSVSVEVSGRDAKACCVYLGPKAK